MSAPLSIISRLSKVLIPTSFQAFLAFVLSLIFLIASQIDRVLALVGIGDVAINAAGSAVHTRFQSILTSPIASSAALVTFWATVGLVAYLVCWSLYNLLIEARNEVTLETQYTNRGRWTNHFVPLAYKLGGAAVLILMVASLKPGLSLWLALWVPLLAGFNVTSVLSAFGAVLGLAAHLYLIFAAGIITITPWYRPAASD